MTSGLNTNTSSPVVVPQSNTIPSYHSFFAISASFIPFTLFIFASFNIEYSYRDFVPLLLIHKPDTLFVILSGNVWILVENSHPASIFVGDFAQSINHTMSEILLASIHSLSSILFAFILPQFSL
jgi:hypothetical protein